MKRIWIALGLTVFLGVVCFLGIYYSQCKSEVIIEKLELAQNAAEQEDLEQTKTLTEEISDLWDKWSHTANTFIHHVELEPVESAITSMEGYLESGMIDHYRVACHQTKELIRHAANTELPTLANIF